MTKHYLAIDLGAESGRLILGTLADDKLSLKEVHRFANGPVRKAGSLHWNIQKLFDEVKVGLKKAAKLKLPIASISTDSWGVDYILYGANGRMMLPVYHYRDPRTARGVEVANAKVGWPGIFAETGIQFMALNTIYQLAAEDSARLKRADSLLLIGDAFNHYLCGQGAAEVSLASTTQLYNPVTKDWSKKLLAALKLPKRLFPKIVPSGAKLGRLKPSLAREVGLPPLEVIASCSHDTGAAVAAVPGQGRNWAYLSSGTWSLMGVEARKPVLTARCRELNFTNEIGYGGSVRLLKNISGLWLVQECRREWAKAGREYDYATLTRLAADAAPFRSLVNPADSRFLAPDGMPGKIAALCRETGQPEPSNPGEFVRCSLESLALLYRRTLLMLETLTGMKIERLHIVGGGSQNALLNQFAANSIQRTVVTGPVEATAAGNIIVQALALGDLPSLEAARQVIANSSETTTVQPRDAALWQAQYERFEKLVK
jgi:rhamnulokinase